jgi:predicted N-acyltransferase
MSTKNRLAPILPAQYHAVTCRSIRDVDWAEWNQLRDPEADLFMDPRYILAVENSMGSVCSFRQVVVRDDDGRAVAAACFCAYTIEGPSLATGTARKILTAIERVLPGFFGLRMLLCGLPISSGSSHLRFTPGVDRVAVLRLLDEIARDFAAEERAHVILFKEFEPAEAGDLTSLEELGYRRGDSLPMNCVPSHSQSFEGYLSGISSAKRYKIQHSRKKAAKLGLTFEHRSGAEGAAELYSDQVHTLYEAVLDRAKVRFETLPAEFFREVARQLPQEALFTFAIHEGRIVGFALSLFCPGRFDQMFMGVDYDLNRKLDVYFNLFYEALGTAYERRPRLICVGQTTDDVKHEKLGAYQVPLTLYVKARRPLVRSVLAVRFEWFFPNRPLKYAR